MEYPDIIDYLNGHSDPELQKAMEEWIAASPENQASFQRVRLIWETSVQEHKAPDPDLDKAWKAVSQRTVQQAAIRRIPVVWRRVAAAIILLIIGYSSYLFAQKPDLITFSAANQSIPAKVELPDGTLVYLNQDSKLIYPENFAGKTRSVELIGEAYFEVNRREDQPFIIQTQATKVKVLGTTFNVMAYPDSARTRVAVTSGTVAFFPEKEQGNQVILAANESAVYHKQEHQIIKSLTVDPAHLAWKERKIRFVNQRLETVIETLEKRFDVVLQLSDPAAGQCRLTAEMPSDDISTSLKILTALFKFELELPTANTYLLKGTGCN